MPIDYRHGYGFVKYRITIKERIQIIIAHIKTFFNGKCPGHNMPEDLEELLCGFIPSRHRIIKNEKHKRN